MTFITVPVVSGEERPEHVVNLERVVSFYVSNGFTRINLSNGSCIWTEEYVFKKLKDYLRMNRISFVKMGE